MNRVPISSELLKWRQHLEQSGYVLLQDTLDAKFLESIAERLSACLSDTQEPNILRSRGETYGSRNVLSVFPDAAILLQTSPLRDFVEFLLGPNAGIVRVLFFDKPPTRSWSLPWHKDRTIAVQRHDLPSKHFQNPTRKADVCHVEAPETLLQKMLTLRVHLDAMTEENGPLSVIPESHAGESTRSAVELRAEVGDVLAMRPLLSHSSRSSFEGTKLNRRVVHFELAPDYDLPDKYKWHSFIPVNRCTELKE